MLYKKYYKKVMIWNFCPTIDNFKTKFLLFEYLSLNRQRDCFTWKKKKLGLDKKVISMQLGVAMGQG